MTVTPENQPYSKQYQRSSDRGRGRGHGSRGRGSGRRGRGTPDDSNRTTRRGRGGSGRCGQQERFNQGRDGLSDEDVMIQFMHLMRAGDEEARKIFEDFGNPKGPSGQRSFVKNVRTFLSGRPQNQKYQSEKNEDSYLKVDSKDDIAIAHDVREIEGAMIKNAISVNQDENTAETRRNQAESSDKAMDFQDIMTKLSIKSNSSEEKKDRNSDMEPKTTLSTKKPEEIKKQIVTSPPPGLGPFNSFSSTPEKDLRHSSNSNISIETPLEQNENPSASTAQIDPAENADESDESEKQKNVTASLKWQPKRFLTRIEEQPGKLLVNNKHATPSGYPSLKIPTKTQFVATWSLPLQYLQQRTLQNLQMKKEKALKAADAAETEEERNSLIASIISPKNLTIRDALTSLTVGLYRRGCQENGSSHSIISKQVVPRSDGSTDAALSQQGTSNEYQFEIDNQTGTIYGTVPFYTPRTPGNVVLRLYFEEDAPITLATSTCIKVIVNFEDLEPTLRFILSNFKSKKSSPNAGISCINSFASVLQQSHSSMKQHYPRNNNNSMDGSGRALWGCICESKKIFDAFRFEYSEKRGKLEEQIIETEAEYESFQNSNDGDKNSNEKEVDESDDRSQNQSSEEDDSNQQLQDLKIRKKSLMGERASNERKWREVQGAYACVLSAILNNHTNSFLLKHDIVMKLRLEYELWCPLCETFAPNPFEVQNETEHDFKINYPHPITNAHIYRCKQSCANMQKEILGFIPKKTPFTSLDRSKVVSLVDQLSKAMEKLYNTEHIPTIQSIQMKARARDLTQNAVSMCDKFPQGTKVIIFGSSANGFGSPTSDLDMCLQLPSTFSMKSFEGNNGSAAMASLVEKLKEIGMKDVDDARLTARIPVIKYSCPSINDEGSSAKEAAGDMIECDISIQNPLAVINTALLRTYSLLKPEVRIVVGIIKKWAKSRDINNPSNHTLSSYGYIIMLLHFLTTHKATAGGIEPFHHNNDKDGTAGCPILPNLQWMHPNWLQSNTTYSELESQPRNQYTMMPHPSETSYLVNKYFFQPSDEVTLKNLQLHLNREDGRSSVGRILASFYYYYAYEFDYKNHVVSLQSHLYGPVQRETKGENDGWKCYGQSLSIEDPFERFYDVAHVLKPLTFQKIRREFALAYTKIVEMVQEAGPDSKEFGQRLIDTICERDNDKS